MADRQGCLLLGGVECGFIQVRQPVGVALGGEGEGCGHGRQQPNSIPLLEIW